MLKGGLQMSCKERQRNIMEHGSNNSNIMNIKNNTSGSSVDLVGLLEGQFAKVGF